MRPEVGSSSPYIIFFKLQVIFQGNKKLIVDKDFFEFTRSPFSRQYKNMDLNGFIKKINEDLSIMRQIGSVNFNDQSDLDESSSSMESSSHVASDDDSTQW